MLAEKIREIDTADLKKQLTEQEETLFRLRFQLGMGQTEGINKYRGLKRDRARMLGVLRERELKGAVK
ncbi:MAG: 50S ribosomal protein L29 [Bryobacteraceae bacterium]|nr:50S ribosomal protein L29 [Bryobacteraceae bacterium]